MAKRFQFRLETVLKVRKRKEDEKKRIVAERIRQITKLRNRAMSLNEQILTNVRLARNIALQPELDVSLMSRQRYWITHLQRGVLDTETQIRELEAKLAQERQVLAEAAKEVKVIEKLREKALERYNRGLARLETIESDELAIQQFVHQHEGVLMR